MHGKKEFGKLASDFRDCRDVLIALGDENRLHLGRNQETVAGNRSYNAVERSSQH